jgi:hypothetical protein
MRSFLSPQYPQGTTTKNYLISKWNSIKIHQNLQTETPSWNFKRYTHFKNVRFFTYGGLTPDFQNTVTQIFSHNPITKTNGGNRRRMSSLKIWTRNAWAWIHESFYGSKKLANVELKSAQACCCPCSIKCLLKDIKLALSPSIPLPSLPFRICCFGK